MNKEYRGEGIIQNSEFEIHYLAFKTLTPFRALCPVVIPLGRLALILSGSAGLNRYEREGILNGTFRNPYGNVRVMAESKCGTDRPFSGFSGYFNHIFY